MARGSPERGLALGLGLFFGQPPAPDEEAGGDQPGDQGEEGREGVEPAPERRAGGRGKSCPARRPARRSRPRSGSRAGGASPIPPAPTAPRATLGRASRRRGGPPGSFGSSSSSRSRRGCVRRHHLMVWPPSTRPRYSSTPGRLRVLAPKLREVLLGEGLVALAEGLERPGHLHLEHERLRLGVVLIVSTYAHGFIGVLLARGNGLSRVTGGPLAAGMLGPGPPAGQFYFRPGQAEAPFRRTRRQVEAVQALRGCGRGPLRPTSSCVRFARLH